MIISLQGASNARDLGGIKTPFGTVQKGRLIRSGKLQQLTPQDEKTLLSHNLQRVVDLRTSTEMQNVPDVVIEGVLYTQISVIRATTFGISYESSDGLTIATKLEQGVERMKARGETPFEHMNILYQNFVADDYCIDAYGKFLRLLAEEPTQGATLWHCSAGKDRVGTCTALLLWCLGASKQDIFADYMLTNQQTLASAQSIVTKVTPFVCNERLALVKTMLLVQESYLTSFFEAIDKRFGNVDGFLKQCGVTTEHLQKLRKNYLV